MVMLRTFLHDHGRLAVLLLALALAAKALIPAGYMVGKGARILTVEICADAQGGTYTRHMVVPQSSAHGDDTTQGEGAHKADGVCAWSGLGVALPAGADPALLVLALLFILALGFARVPVPHLDRSARLRPPLRGPPLTV